LNAKIIFKKNSKGKIVIIKTEEGAGAFSAKAATVTDTMLSSHPWIRTGDFENPVLLSYTFEMSTHRYINGWGSIKKSMVVSRCKCHWQRLARHCDTT
jgi:hypothetical protein